MAESGDKPLTILGDDWPLNARCQSLGDGPKSQFYRLRLHETELTAMSVKFQFQQRTKEVKSRPSNGHEFVT